MNHYTLRSKLWIVVLTVLACAGAAGLGTYHWFGYGKHLVGQFFKSSVRGTMPDIADDGHYPAAWKRCWAWAKKHWPSMVPRRFRKERELPGWIEKAFWALLITLFIASLVLTGLTGYGNLWRYLQIIGLNLLIDLAVLALAWLYEVFSLRRTLEWLAVALVIILLCLLVAGIWLYDLVRHNLRRIVAVLALAFVGATLWSNLPGVPTSLGLPFLHIVPWSHITWLEWIIILLTAALVTVLAGIYSIMRNWRRHGIQRALATLFVLLLVAVCILAPFAPGGTPTTHKVAGPHRTTHRIVPKVPSKSIGAPVANSLSWYQTPVEYDDNGPTRRLSITLQYDGGNTLWLNVDQFFTSPEHTCPGTPGSIAGGIPCTTVSGDVVNGLFVNRGWYEGNRLLVVELHTREGVYVFYVRYNDVNGYAEPAGVIVLSRP